ncbi:hypothetical protein V492_04355 [Pseudogymnoascus sp. VKM F-4246]|nr:hypothetical protein V492_04355 [Pseudogymnoascus sp. VKM F-4246]
MDQATRSTYQSRAPPRSSDSWFPASLSSNASNHHPSGECHLLIPHPITPHNWALWTKIRILLYNHDGEEHGTLWGMGDSCITICAPNPAGPNPVTLEGGGYNMWAYVEAAMFEYMAMTSSGSVVFHNWESGFFADQETLETGRLVLCAFGNNGGVKKSGRIWPVFTKDVFNLMTGVGKDVEGLIEGDSWIFDEEAPPDDMQKPILEIMATLAEAGFFDENGRGEEAWRGDIESYAPGYLEMEEEGGGMAEGYEHGAFRED